MIIMKLLITLPAEVNWNLFSGVGETVYILIRKYVEFLSEKRNFNTN